jgi:hypothetical protein
LGRIFSGRLFCFIGVAGVQELQNETAATSLLFVRAHARPPADKRTGKPQATESLHNILYSLVIDHPISCSNLHPRPDIRVVPEVKELDVYQVDGYDPAEESCKARYLVFVHFDAGAQRGYSSETEFNRAGSWIAERLIRLDESESPVIISRLRFNANRVTIDAHSLKGGPYSPGAGITLWIELSPEWSRLRNRSLVQLQILRMQSELRAQSQTGRCPTTTQ